MSEFVIWWKDSDSMKWIVETFTKPSEAQDRVSELKRIGDEFCPLEVLSIKKQPLKGV